MSKNPNSIAKPGLISAYIFLGAALLAFIQSYLLLSPLILSFFLILLISLAVNPLILKMRKLTGGRKIPTFLITLGLIIGIASIGLALFGPMKTSAEKLYYSWPSYWERLQKPLIKLEQKTEIFEKKIEEEVRTEIAQDQSVADGLEAKQEPPTEPPPEQADSPRPDMSEMFQGAIGSFTALAVNGLEILIVLVTVFFGVIFTLMNPRPIFAAILSIVPENHQDQTVIIMQRVAKFIPVWVGATSLGMITIGTLVFLFMWPIFGFTDALVLGMTAGLLEAIPYLGPIFSAIPALLLAIGEGGMTPLWVLLAYIVIQFLENNVILPLIMSRGMRVHPLAVIFSMLLCVIAFGVLGVLIATPLVKIVSIIHDELYRKRFLPSVTDEDLDHLAAVVLQEVKSSER
ncbi:AI-2E family transporter [Desulfopila inferna]|uniref:AI-2E family transporter n=1 Tax=Desulfopila inferna TaxID=468528 RepID=UPI001964BB8C|nr:AI-2E family transporter [Desulfopila inferna]MBM9606087.1 AI-2E family transporter [Desulfopila inferna]